ncbi:Uncharacterized protein TCM_041313 [Theobroma cacao]|uniref:Uncharacterized protein n=1 Tax=Theobroma cacao TaxID=3641 RepID=A0A061GV21_THECC|nr:Uncharacterized protein TCM_041313 [Theobroma cacao]
MSKLAGEEHATCSMFSAVFWVVNFRLENGSSNCCFIEGQLIFSGLFFGLRMIEIVYMVFVIFSGAVQC